MDKLDIHDPAGPTETERLMAELHKKAVELMRDPKIQRDCLDATYEKYKKGATEAELTKLKSQEFRTKMENPFLFGPSDTLGQKFVKDVGQAIIRKISESFTSEEITQLQSVGFPVEKEETAVSDDKEFVFDGGGRKRRKKRSTKKKRSKKRRSKKRRSRTRRRRR